MHVCKKNLTCKLDIELTYVSTGFDMVSFHCGSDDDLNIPEEKYPVIVSSIYQEVNHLFRREDAWEPND